MCWKDISTTIAGENFLKIFRYLAKYILSLLKQSAELLNQVFVSVVDYSYHIIFIKNLDRVLTDLLEESFKSKISMRCGDYSNANVFISLYCNFSLTYWVSWATQYWNQGCFRNKNLFSQSCATWKSTIDSCEQRVYTAVVHQVVGLLHLVNATEHPREPTGSPELRTAPLHHCCRFQRQHEKLLPLFPSSLLIQVRNFNFHYAEAKENSDLLLWV